MVRRILGLPGALALSLGLCGCIHVSLLGGGRIEQVVVRESPRWFERNRIALVDVDGFLSMSGGSCLLTTTTVADVKGKLERAAHDRRVKAIVLRINSPGGQTSASDMIYREVLEFKEQSGKPVVASLMGTAASGGYYVALAADCIVASPTTVTGSVGVLMHFLNMEGLYSKIGLRSEVIKSGEMKDMGALGRSMTPEEREILKGVMNELFKRFTEAVQNGRTEITDEDMATISDGRVLTADQALQLHMVDAVGYLDDAIEKAQELAGIRDADVILYKAGPQYSANVYSRSAVDPGLMKDALRVLFGRAGPAFLYLWVPGS